MAEIEKAIEQLKQLEHCITKSCDETCTYYEDDMYHCHYDVSTEETVENVIQTIRELQEQNGSFQRTINALMGQIQEMEAQIPKWHLVADGDLPSMSDTYIVACIKGEGLIGVTFATFQSKYKKWNMTGARAYWKVIAWCELPKFEGVE